MKLSTILIGIICMLQWTGCQSKKHHEKEILTLQVTSPLVKDTLIYQDYVAQVNSYQHIELRALERGYLQKIYVDEGQAVKKGQLLFQVMPLIYQAEVSKANAEVSYAHIEYENTKSLADSNIVSKSELALVKAKLEKAQAELNLASTHLGFTEIRAPFDGIVGRFHVRQGSLLDEGELLSTLSDNEKMWVYFNVPEAAYLDLSDNDALNYQSDVRLKLANQKLFDQKGIVETIEAVFNNENGNIAFRATFPNPKGLLRHGETGNIMLPTPLHQALIIPQKATFEILDKKYVYVLGKDNILESREIKVAQELPHLFVISEGLHDGEKILVEGLRKVRNKQKINAEFLNVSEIISGLDKLHAE
ncbi:efflux RND transporter periplasmic adaptor subunit [Belliella sp. DSM 111904]|uniref:Efflux RND transporter periplasmic adaptor subunit n=1 Tax=Belliella filtrata TaxID=2923435 RepID=A0ABS9V4Q6_9BACT|nr:efflux RND transporter periplasmic adaptor subunit [Belliella filtrata]MCH7411204.1 efflux RND transporter periplasmic adaptor subunit [Belliella filtrata]